MTESCGESGFDRIFSERVWGGESRSGPGSDPRRTRHYRALLARFLRQHPVRRVVDLGCGDWSSSRLMDWSGVDYVGIDVVPDLIERLTIQYARPGVRFLHGDLTRMPLPDADLAICKDVLQHWPNATVTAFLERLRGFPFALVTNDHTVLRWNGVGRQAIQRVAQVNRDIPMADWRPLRLRESPFHVPARRWGWAWMRVGPIHYFKEVLLLRR